MANIIMILLTLLMSPNCVNHRDFYYTLALHYEFMIILTIHNLKCYSYSTYKNDLPNAS